MLQWSKQGIARVCEGIRHLGKGRRSIDTEGVRGEISARNLLTFRKMKT